MANKLILPEEIKKELVKEPQQEAEVIPFKLLPGDKDEDWLWSLPVDTVFLLSNKPQKDQYNRPVYDANLAEFHVAYKLGDVGNRAVKLIKNLNEEAVLWVDSKIFSGQFILYKIIFLGKD